MDGVCVYPEEWERFGWDNGIECDGRSECGYCKVFNWLFCIHLLVKISSAARYLSD
jgi:hypothetical protein